MMNFYYFNSTHWDREWYLPFQGFRLKLLEVTECILHMLEDVDEYDAFTFDGQTIVLEDVTEIRPDWKDRLRRQITDGRLRVGPWYVMPDEFLVSGEALIRNLLVGHELSLDYGHDAWKVGYICDIFGHIAQLPQILAGFDIHCAVAARGIPHHLPQLLHWRGPDDSVCKLIKLGFGGYGNFTIDFGYEEKPWEKTAFLEKFAKYYARHIAGDPDLLIMSDAQDHHRPSAQTLDILQWIREAYPDSRIMSTDFLNISEFSDGRKLPVVTGELAATGASGGTDMMTLVAGSLSSRYDIKYANDRCQSRLELETEPLLALAEIDGKDIATDRMLLKNAWKTLLKNQSHDFICGCSVDETHFCGMPRYYETMQIADGIFNKHFPRSRKKDENGDYVIKIFNPLPYEYDHAFSLTLALPTGYPVEFTEPRAPEAYNSFRIYSADGQELSYALRSVEKNMCYPYLGTEKRDLYTIELKSPLTPCGWTNLRLSPSATPVRSFSSMRRGRSGAENRHLRLDIASDGTFSVEDKRCGRKFEKFNEYLLDGEIGDGWYHVAPLKNQELVASSASATVKLLIDSPVLIEYEITRRYRFPAEIKFQANCNAQYMGTVHSDNESVLEIRTVVSLERDAAHIRANTRIDNNLRDYRLRLAVPTGSGGAYFASQAFTMLERKPGRQHGEDTLTAVEAEAVEKNFGGIAGKSNGKCGMAFISTAGLHEAACHEFDPEHIYVTLLRTFRRTFTKNGEPDGELQKKLEFRYAYYFSDETAKPSDFYKQQQMLQTEIKYRLYPGRELDSSSLPAIKLIGNVVLSALKPAADGSGIILRLFNPSAVPEEARIELLSPAKEVLCCDLQEKTVSAFGQDMSTINTVVEANKILTFRLLS